MPKTLIIAEKDSVAKVFASVVGAKRSGKYMESENYIVSHCVGHLCSLVMPEEYDAGLKAWSLDTLPIIPEQYRFKVIERTRSQYQVVKELMNRADVDTIINACDGDREGEAIFRLVYQQAKCKKPVMRLWISSMEAEAIREGLQDLKPMSEYDSLAEAAYSRDVADWVVGINLSRLYSLCFNSKSPLSVGRVQTPTVNMVVKRELEIINFKPVDYWVITANLGEFSVTHRCDSEKEANAVCNACKNAVASITELTEKQKKSSVTLYDLTALQQDCNRFFGISAANTLDSLQNLYESKYATYPRTESQYITDSEAPVAEEILQRLESENMLPGISVSKCSVKSVVKNKAVTSHPALMPTLSGIQALADGTITDATQRNILIMLCWRLVQATLPPRILLSTRVIADINGYDFATTGNVVLYAGWKAAEEQMKKILKASGCAEEDKEPDNQAETLPKMAEGDQFPVQGSSSEKKKTKPPQRYTEATLLEAMRTCGKQLDDKEQREAMKDRGLGTPATRAAILERIIWTESNPSGYITRGPEGEKGKKADNKHLYPTERAMKFMSLLPDKLKEPATTGEWEFELAQIQKGLKEKEAFLTGIEDFVRELVNYEKTHKRTPQEMAVFSVKVGGGDILCNCPICGSPVVSYQYTKDKTGKKLAKAISGYRCSSSACKLRVPRICGGKKLTDAQMKKLITTGSAGVIENFFSESKNRYYSAEVILERDETGMYTGKAKMVFPDKEIKEILCKCPLCGDNIVPFKYTKNVSSATGKLMPKTYQGWKCANRQCNLDALFNPVAQKMLTAEQAKSLFTKGETETLQGFVSAKGKKFEAKLLLAKDENGHYTGAKDFVFPPRPPRQSNSSQQAINPDEVICDCPNCGEGKIVPFKYTSKMDGAVKHCFHCSNRSCTLKPIYDPCNGHKWKKEELVKLYTLGKTGTITDFVSKKTGKTYSARIAANRDKDNRIIATEYDFLWN